jgi:superfamily II DNA or RNA helicase
VNDPRGADAALRAEITRLTALLDAHGIAWRVPDTAATAALSHASATRLSTDDKVALMRRLFRGRDDVYALRWEQSTTGKSGYAPACGNEWRPGVCEKPRVKCSACSHRRLLPVTDRVIYDHLSVAVVVGVYPLQADDTCWFLAVDFDDAEWRDDAQAFVRTCRDLGVPVSLEISRSGAGAHAWIFFARAVRAREARALGDALLSATCTRTRQLALSSYDRLFPNQDTMPAGGFGNLIALPLQKRVRAQGHSVFVDDALQPYVDQWQYLTSVVTMDPCDITSTVHRAIGSASVLDVTSDLASGDDEAASLPWRREVPSVSTAALPLPASVVVTRANQLFVATADLPQPLRNRVIRLAAFPNPAYFEAQAMRRSVWNVPRLIAMAEPFPLHIALPRGCEDTLTALLTSHQIACQYDDERTVGTPISAEFHGTLRAAQQRAVDAMLARETGVLCAPTAFGKTVVAAALIAARGVNTLVLVHRTSLLEQWRLRLQTFLRDDERDVAVGSAGGGKTRLTGRVDVAVMQSLVRRGAVDPIVESYGHVIVDECHHVGAASVTAILRRVRARFVTGLTATPERRDGLQALVYQQCGPIRHRATPSGSQPSACSALVTRRRVPDTLADVTDIQEIFRQLAGDAGRTDALVHMVARAYRDGRKVLVLTERTAHVDALRERIAASVVEPLVLHGRMSAKLRATQMTALASLAPDAPRVLVATGKLIGEGFDHAALDTLVLAMPVSWKGILQQYAGRLHREHASKTDVQIHDLVDTGHGALERMWAKRQRGYRAMGYRIEEDG